MKEIPDAPFLKKNKTRLGLEVVDLQGLFLRQKNVPHRIDRPHRPDFFSLILFTQGGGAHFVDFQTYPVSKGTIVYTEKGQVHAFGAKSGTEGVQVMVSDFFLRRHGLCAPSIGLSVLRAASVQAPLIRPGDADYEAIPPIVAAIEREYRRDDDAFREDILASLVQHLFLAIERVRSSKVSSIKTIHSATFEKFGAILGKKICETRNARDYAELLGISYKHLNEVCKEAANLTAKECVDRALILEIERRLATLDLSTKEISAQTGFDEPTNFVKYFRARTGLTPTQFRESLR